MARVPVRSRHQFRRRRVHHRRPVDAVPRRTDPEELPVGRRRAGRLWRCCSSTSTRCAGRRCSRRSSGVASSITYLAWVFGGTADLQIWIIRYHSTWFPLWAILAGVVFQRALMTTGVFRSSSDTGRRRTRHHRAPTRVGPLCCGRLSGTRSVGPCRGASVGALHRRSDAVRGRLAPERRVCDHRARALTVSPDPYRVVYSSSARCDGRPSVKHSRWRSYGGKQRCRRTDGGDRQPRCRSGTHSLTPADDGPSISAKSFSLIAAFDRSGEWKLDGAVTCAHSGRVRSTSRCAPPRVAPDRPCA